MCPVDESEVRALLGTVEDDFGAVGRDVEVADDKRRWQLGKRALGTGLQVDDPEIPVVEVSAQNDQRLTIRRERHPPCTARQDQGGQGIGSAVPAGAPQRKGRTDVSARRNEERARALLSATPSKLKSRPSYQHLPERVLAEPEHSLNRRGELSSRSIRHAGPESPAQVASGVALWTGPRTSLGRTLRWGRRIARGRDSYPCARRSRPRTGAHSATRAARARAQGA